MRLKWVGLALLLFDVMLAPLRSYRRDDMEYIKKKALEKSGSILMII